MNNIELRKKYGDYPIQSLRIFKKPIHSVLDKFINLISFGKFSEEFNPQL